MSAAAPAVHRKQAEWMEAHRIARINLSAFVRLSWPTLNPGRPLVWGRAIQAMCDHLQAVTEGRIRRLIINIPPGHMKTTVVSICWPAWEWLRYPERRYLCGSYGADISVKVSRDRRNLIRSDWYRSAFGEDWTLADDGSAVTAYANTRNGWMRAVSTGGAGTGLHGDRVLIDDPIKAEDIYTAALDTHVRWFRETMETRVTDLSTSAFVLIMQRLHARDLAGVLLEEGGWDLLCLPAEYEPARHCRTSIGWQDWRRTPGELLFPERFPLVELDRKRVSLGAARYAAQYQQSPVAGDGNVFSRSWWRYYDAAPACDEYVGSWDCTFKKSDSSDYVVGQVWGRKGADFYLLDQHRERAGFVDTQRAFLSLAEKWPQCRRWLVELAANGVGLVDTMRRVMPGIIGVDVAKLGGKEARAAYISPAVESGNVYLPRQASWVSGFVEECAAFPRGDNDDQVDAATQALRDMSTRVGGASLPSLAPDQTRPRAAALLQGGGRWQR